MNWRDVLLQNPAPGPTSQYSHNPQNYIQARVSENCEDIEKQGTERRTSCAAQLRLRAFQACEWSALYAVLDAAQVAYDGGEATREEVEALTGYAAERSREIPEHCEGERISDLLAREPIVRVRSRLLGEVVVWVSDAVEITEEIAEVVYRQSELQRLIGRSPAELRAIHEVKRALDGEVM